MKLDIELLASILGVISVGLVILRNVWAFPIGIVMVILYIKIFYDAKLYSDMLLQYCFVGFQLQGWWDWSRSEKGADDKIVVRQLSAQQWWLTLVIQIVGSLLLGSTIRHFFQDAALPWPDAFATVMSLLAQWWMNKRYLENWTLWIAVDVLYLYIYWTKNLVPTTILYGIFLLMAVYGYLEWRKKRHLPN